MQTAQITTESINQIPVINISHLDFFATIALQGAQLIKWQPKGQKEVLWLSELEPFNLGNAIRGGVPICYPWFGGVKSPSHGTARLTLWELIASNIAENTVALTLALPDSIYGRVAEVTFLLAREKCHITFKHLTDQPAQVALHSYFNIGDIEQTEVQGLPTSCFNSLTNRLENVSSPREIHEGVDCIYSVTSLVKPMIKDRVNQREIALSHQNVGEVVLWNPWHKATSAMSENAYKTMICLESARLARRLEKNESISVEIQWYNKE